MTTETKISDSAKTLLLIGCGNMGAAIISGYRKADRSARIVAIDPQVERANDLLCDTADIEVYGNVERVKDLIPDLSILAVKPQQLHALDASTIGIVRKSMIVSALAGTGIGTLREVFESNRIARVMPNLPALVAQGMSIACFTPLSLNDRDKILVESLFKCVGKFAWLENEKRFELASPLTGCGPGFLLAVAESMIAAAVDLGMPLEQADYFVRQTFLGTATVLSERANRSARELKLAVASPGGTTEAGLHHLEAPEALPKCFSAAIRAAYSRATEISA